MNGREDNEEDRLESVDEMRHQIEEVVDLLNENSSRHIFSFSFRKLRAALKQEQATSEVLRARLKNVLWDYIPRQRKLADIPIDTGSVLLKENGTVHSIAGYDLEGAFRSHRMEPH